MTLRRYNRRACVAQSLAFLEEKFGSGPHYYGISRGIDERTQRHRLEIVDTDLIGGMQVPAGFGERPC
ncbi:MAG: hypothetical protein E5Y32_03880 [Mesorhizobium sp.]|nr:MAG: hypothetical protein E5Y32_03880 [Mesorhizobium sp.]